MFFEKEKTTLAVLVAKTKNNINNTPTTHIHTNKMQWSGEIDELLKGEGEEEKTVLPNSLRLEGLMEEELELVRNLVSSLKRGEVAGSFASARAAANLYCQVFENYEWKSTKAAMDIVRRLAVILGDAAPAELTIGNIGRRTLKIIREAYADARKTSIDSEEMGKEKALSLKASTMIMEQGPSLANMLGKDEDDFSQLFDIKDAVLDELEALADEITVVYKDIAKQADEHINSNEVVLVLGHSSSVEGFLKAAAKNRRFEVFVAEGLPAGNGRYMADRLSKEGIPTTLIPDSAIFAIMPRVNKVLSGVHCIMANGVLLALTGTHLLAMAAKQYSVPFVVLTGLYKLCPQYPYPADMDMYSSFRSPAGTLPYKNLPSEQGSTVKVPSPLYEYVPAELVTLYISEQAHNPSFLYRLLSEYYHPEDYELQ